MEDKKINIFGGVDNGTTGTIAIITPDKTFFIKVPVKKERSYTKEVKYITRIDYQKLVTFLKEIKKEGDCFFYLERPMINPGRWVASMSAIRALEATIIAFEEAEIEFDYIDSRKWQHYFFPDKKKENLKQSSLYLGLDLFPEHAKMIKKHKDADALLIAKYLKEMYDKKEENNGKRSNSKRRNYKSE